MKLKLDENLSRHLKPELAKLGFDADTVEDEGLRGRSDAEVGNAAANADRIVLTLDVEFADIRKHPPGTHPGIVLFRPRSLGESAVGEFVLAFARGAGALDLRGCLVVVEPDKVRIRRPNDLA